MQILLVYIEEIIYASHFEIKIQLISNERT